MPYCRYVCFSVFATIMCNMRRLSLCSSALLKVYKVTKVLRIFLIIVVIAVCQSCIKLKTRQWWYNVWYKVFKKCNSRIRLAFLWVCYKCLEVYLLKLSISVLVIMFRWNINKLKPGAYAGIAGGISTFPPSYPLYLPFPLQVGPPKPARGSGGAL